MTRSSSLVERPILRLLLLALMGLALASRLALGATLPVGGTEDAANPADPLAKLRAAMIMCHIGHGHDPAPTVPQHPLRSDLLLFDQSDNTHALASNPVMALLGALRWSAIEFLGNHQTAPPPLWPVTKQARAPPRPV
jgi:hypothetical protein